MTNDLSANSNPSNAKIELNVLVITNKEKDEKEIFPNISIDMSLESDDFQNLVKEIITNIDYMKNKLEINYYKIDEQSVNGDYKVDISINENKLSILKVSFAVGDIFYTSFYEMLIDSNNVWVLDVIFFELTIRLFIKEGILLFVDQQNLTNMIGGNHGKA